MAISGLSLVVGLEASFCTLFPFLTLRDLRIKIVYLRPGYWKVVSCYEATRASCAFHDGADAHRCRAVFEYPSAISDWYDAMPKVAADIR